MQLYKLTFNSIAFFKLYLLINFCKTDRYFHWCFLSCFQEKLKQAMAMSPRALRLQTLLWDDGVGSAGCRDTFPVPWITDCLRNCHFLGHIMENSVWQCWSQAHFISNALVFKGWEADTGSLGCRLKMLLLDSLTWCYQRESPDSHTIAFHLLYSLCL